MSLVIVDPDRRFRCCSFAAAAAAAAISLSVSLLMLTLLLLLLIDPLLLLLLLSIRNSEHENYDKSVNQDKASIWIVSFAAAVAAKISVD